MTDLNKYVEKSLERVDRYFKVDEGNVSRPADIIADLMHYCEINGIDFERELESAIGYYAEETDDNEITLNI